MLADQRMARIITRLATKGAVEFSLSSTCHPLELEAEALA
jgi:hypothetical protein